MNETAPLLYILPVGEAFRLPRDGEPVPYDQNAMKFEFLFILRQRLDRRIQFRYMYRNFIACARRQALPTPKLPSNWPLEIPVSAIQQTAL